jgi:hypothetical protein
MKSKWDEEEKNDGGFQDLTGGMDDSREEQEHNDNFWKTFITDHHAAIEQSPTFTLHDIMIPAGRTAKLVRVPEPYKEDFWVSEVCDKLKLNEAAPVIILAGAMGTTQGKVLAGIARAAFRAGAYVVDSGVGSGIEKFCMRKDVPLIGVCPEAAISYPKINPTKRKENELANGHTHFFLLGDDAEHPLSWGQEAKMKAELALRLAKGRSSYGSSWQCKVVTIVIGDNPSSAIEDIREAQENMFPLIFL